MKQVVVLALSLLLSMGALAAPAPQNAASAATKTSRKKRAAAVNPITRRLDEMQQAIGAQQQQIQQLMQELQSRDAAIQQLQQQNSQAQSAATAAQQKADAAASQASQQQQEVAAVKNDVTDLKQNSTNVALSLQDTQKSIVEMGSPLALHYKGITITPGGFLAAETVWRRSGLGADINTPFNSIPFAGSSATHLSEFYGSGRQSRVSMLAEGKLNDAKLTGYVEADFLSAGMTSNNNESNSYTLRQRQMWGQAALSNGWSFTGGQMWSLITETKNGVDNRTEVLPMTIDAQYHVGFSWARQFGFRVSRNFGNKMWFAFYVENPQTLVGG
jgi:chemotaxis protein histidine kinase CheA